MSSVLGVLFLSLIILLLMGAPVAIALGLSALLGMYFGEMSFMLLIQRLYNTFDAFPLLAVPFFVLAGDIMQKGTIANSLLGLCRTLIGHVRGGLGLISVTTCLFYGALSGSAPATTAAVGGIMIPAMDKDGYPRLYATALNTAGGCLGVMIPPSVPLILYGSTVGCSISDLFIAGIVPGILVGICFMVMAYVSACRNHWGTRQARASLWQKLKATWDARWALMVPVIVLGGIYGGILTPTEAGCVAVVYSLFVEAFITRSLTWKKLYDIIFASMRTTGAIFAIIATANALSIVLVYYNTQEILYNMIMGISSSPIIILLVISAILLFLGTFVETAVIILVMAPMLLPIATAIDITPVQFGIFMLVLLATGFLTPPVGVNLFVGASVGNVSFSKLSAQCLPFCGVMILVGLAIGFFPKMVTFLL